MILLLGSTGYIGSAFESALKNRDLPYRALSRNTIDYTDFTTFYQFLKKEKPQFIINAAGYTGKPNVDACESNKDATLLGNTLFPQTLAHLSSILDIPWGHVSSGCIYSGAFVHLNNQWIIEKNLTQKNIYDIVENSPENVRGFSEDEPPNFSFDAPPCSFYSGTKALAEKIIQNNGKNYIWRLRIPFDHIDNSRNYLSKIQRYAKVYNNFNSLSHRDDFVNACIDTWLQKIPYGTYNVTNPGFVSTSQVVNMMKQILKLDRDFVFWNNDSDFYTQGASAPRSNCIMSTQKLASFGITMRNVQDALESSLNQWAPEAQR